MGKERLLENTMNQIPFGRQATTLFAERVMKAGDESAETGVVSMSHRRMLKKHLEQRFNYIF